MKKNMNTEKHPLDDLFRQGLADLEIPPSPAGRSAFLEQAGKELKGRRGRSAWLLWTVSAVFLLAVTAGILVFLLQDKSSRPVSSGIPAPHPMQMKTVSPATGTAKNPVTGNISPAEKSKAIPPAAGSDKREFRRSAVLASAKAPVTSSGTNPKQSVTAKKYAAPAVTIQTEPDPLVLASPGQIRNDLPIDRLSALSVLLPVPASEEKAPYTLPYPEEKKEIQTSTTSKKKSKPEGKTTFSAGIQYSPEWIFNTLDSNKFVNNFGVEGSFRFGPYSVRTGLGLSVTKGYNQMIIEEEPYLGGYHALQYITYAWDANHYHLVPTIHTEWQEVYDTVRVYKYRYYEKQYTYLQVPLVLGYDFLMREHWSLGVRGGAVMSLLLKSKLLSEEYSPGKDRVVEINDITPDRISLNWQAIGGINAAYHFSRRFSLEAEPDIRYYFNSVYEKKDNTQKPWSVGFRIGFTIKL
jgi:hypothetical protein